MVDILAIVAHPDDVELNVAGTLLRTADRGGTFAVCDVTRGERGTRGSAELRAAETAEANEVLGIDASRRWNLEIPDGDIRITQENVERVVRTIRYFRPSILIFPWTHDRHPDHEQTHRLVREACFNAGLAAVRTTHDGEAQSPFRPDRMYTFFHTWEERPDFIVDVSSQIERKLQAIGAYGSQFTLPGTRFGTSSNEPETFISGEGYIEAILARMRHWGFMIGAAYGEAFKTVGQPVSIRDLRDTL